MGTGAELPSGYLAVTVGWVGVGYVESRPSGDSFHHQISQNGKEMIRRGTSGTLFT